MTYEEGAKVSSWLSATGIHVRAHVGDWGQGRLDVLSPSFVAHDRRGEEDAIRSHAERSRSGWSKLDRPRRSSPRRSVPVLLGAALASAEILALPAVERVHLMPSRSLGAIVRSPFRSSRSSSERATIYRWLARAAKFHRPCVSSVLHLTLTEWSFPSLLFLEQVSRSA